MLVSFPIAQVIKDDKIKESLVVEVGAGAKPRYRVRPDSIVLPPIFDNGITVNVNAKDYEQLIALKNG